MKKLSLLVAASMLVAGALAATPSWVKFSSAGPDKYADGTTVVDGEVYALIWVKTDATFGGINADGSLVDATNNKIVSAASLAKDGGCPTVLFLLDGENVGLDEKGTFGVYLFDTRAAATQAPTGVTFADGKLTFTAVNGFAEAAADIEGQGAAQVAAVEVNNTSTIPGGAPRACITSVKVDGAKVTLIVANTVPYLQYCLSAGPTLGNMNKTTLAEGFNGVAGKAIRVELTDAEDNKFFQIIRK